MNGRRLGVDVGSVRVGVAMSDPGGVLATPLVTLRRDEAGGADLAELVALVEEHEVVEVIVGLPRTLADRHGPAAQAAHDYVEVLRSRLGAVGRDVGVTLSDERLTTVTATRMLSDRGVRGRRQRQVIDQAAAVGILQGYLDTKRSGAGPEDTDTKRSGAGPEDTDTKRSGAGPEGGDGPVGAP